MRLILFLSESGMAFTFPSPNMILMEALGGVFMNFWQTFYPDHHRSYGYTTAAGFMTGEGIGGLLISLIIICGLTFTNVLKTSWEGHQTGLRRTMYNLSKHFLTKDNEKKAGESIETGKPKKVGSAQGRHIGHGERLWYR